MTTIAKKESLVNLLGCLIITKSGRPLIIHYPDDISNSDFSHIEDDFGIRSFCRLLAFLSQFSSTFQSSSSSSVQSHINTSTNGDNKCRDEVDADHDNHNDRDDICQSYIEIRTKSIIILKTLISNNEIIVGIVYDKLSSKLSFSSINAFLAMIGKQILFNMKTLYHDVIESICKIDDIYVESNIKQTNPFTSQASLEDDEVLETIEEFKDFEDHYISHLFSSMSYFYKTWFSPLNNFAPNVDYNYIDKTEKKKDNHDRNFKMTSSFLLDLSTGSISLQNNTMAMVDKNNNINTQDEKNKDNNAENGPVTYPLSYCFEFDSGLVWWQYNKDIQEIFINLSHCFFFSDTMNDDTSILFSIKIPALPFKLMTEKKPISHFIIHKTPIPQTVFVLCIDATPFGSSDYSISTNHLSLSDIKTNYGINAFPKDIEMCLRTEKVKIYDIKKFSFNEVLSKLLNAVMSRIAQCFPKINPLNINRDISGNIRIPQIPKHSPHAPSISQDPSRKSSREKIVQLRASRSRDALQSRIDINQESRNENEHEVERLNS